MPWNDLAEWAMAQRGSVAEPVSPLTMVTLRRAVDADAAEIAFHRDAEFNALMQWAATGRFVLAFAASDRPELTLLCADVPSQVAAQVACLPLVAASLAVADVRSVATLRLTPASVPDAANGR